MAFPSLDLSGRTAVVVGGTTGIGRALTLGLAQAGADVVPTSRRKDVVDEAAALVEAAGRRTLRVTTDVGDEASIAYLLAAAIEAFGKVDILVNCAGRTKRTPTLELSDEEWNDILATNLTGTLRTCRLFGRHMIERRYGRIVNIASLSSFVSMMEVAAYSASKAAVASLTKSLAVEWSRHGVMVNAIAPGVFRTALNQTLLDTTPRGQELLMRTASFVTGHMLVVDGGFLASGVNS
jgi:NAD(P)-dependent dehydrogenase (short-subunit alcohol dehydrogenase family)